MLGFGSAQLFDTEESCPDASTLTNSISCEASLPGCPFTQVRIGFSNISALGVNALMCRRDGQAHRRVPFRGRHTLASTPRPRRPLASSRFLNYSCRAKPTPLTIIISEHVLPSWMCFPAVIVDPLQQADPFIAWGEDSVEYANTHQRV